MSEIGGGFRYSFGGIDEDIKEANSHQLDRRSFDDACTFLRSDVVGADAIIRTPFGTRHLLYADFTASGRACKSIEEYITNEVLPFYGNTHTLASATGSQTTFFRMEARSIIKQFLNANHDDALIFCGSGSTAAVAKFIDIMHRSFWDVKGGEGAAFALKNGFFSEDRWGSCECSLCGVRLKNESLYRAHEHSDGHLRRLEKLQKTTTDMPTPAPPQSSTPAPPQTPAQDVQRLVVFLCDPTAHHSSSLPFREIVKSGTYNGKLRNNVAISVSFDLVDLQIDPSTCKFDVEHLTTELTNCQQINKKAANITTSLNSDKPANLLDSANPEDLTGTLTPVEVAPRFEVVVIAILSAGSNVTGLPANVADISELVHKFDGIVCWDFAAVSAHSKIDFNPADRRAAAVDVGFFSPHKLLGGPGSPGMLLIKKSLLRNAVPSNPGGGVVFYVSTTGHSYIQNSEEREEGGTPDILADIRAGLTFRLHSLLSSQHIATKEYSAVEYLMKNWGKHKRIQLLGPLGFESSPESNDGRMGIISFNIKYGNDLTDIPTNLKGSAAKPRQASAYGGLYLHHHFVVALLNDLFGVQARGGCACAGPLAQFLLGLSAKQNEEFEACLNRTGQEVFRPGFVRASVHFSMNWDDIEHLCQAVLWVADFGWQFLPAYTFVPETGEWEHRVVKPAAHRRWLSGLSLMKLPGGGIGAAVDGRMGQQGSVAGGRSEGDDRPMPKKDPKKVAGAVALPVAGSNQIAFKMDITQALGKLRKASTTRTAPTTETPAMSELQAAMKRMSAKNTSASTKESKSESNPISKSEPNELIKKLSLRRCKVDNDAPLSSTRMSCTTTEVSISSGKVCVTPRTPSASQQAVASAAESDNIQSAQEFISTEISNEISTKQPSGTSAPRIPIKEQKPEAKVSGVAAESSDVGKIGVIETLFVSEVTPVDLEALMAANHELLSSLYAGPRKAVLKSSNSVPPLPQDYAHLLWFALPIDAAQSLLQGTTPTVSADKLFWIPSDPPVEAKIVRPKSSCFEMRLFDEGSQNIHLNPSVGIENAESVNKLLRKRIESITETLNVNSQGSRLTGVLLTDLLSTRLRQIASDFPTTSPNISNDDEDDQPLIQAGKERVAKEKDKREKEGTSGVETPTQDGPKIGKDGRIEMPRQLRRTVGSAIRDFGMIKEGDRLLVGLSGGKDSLTLLHALRDAQKRSPVKFEIAAATVDPQTPEYNPRPLIPYLESLGVTYHFLSYPLIELAKVHMQKNSICAFCARMKRGVLYSCMRKNGYNVLVLGQHLDDICESFVMSAFHNGSLNTMKAHYTIGRGDVRVARPLIYTRERTLARFATEANLPIIADNCPACFSQPKERHRVKLLLAQQEFDHPHVFQTLLQTVRPLIALDEVRDISKKPEAEEDEDDALSNLANQLVTGAAIESIQSTVEALQSTTSTAEDSDFQAEAMLTSCGMGACPKPE